MGDFEFIFALFGLLLFWQAAWTSRSTLATAMFLLLGRTEPCCAN
ncbi:hypothetical protein [Sphingomonas sp.]|nr:hypothetical protein [Sphingomonas sp.]